MNSRSRSREHQYVRRAHIPCSNRERRRPLELRWEDDDLPSSTNDRWSMTDHKWDGNHRRERRSPNRGEHHDNERYLPKRRYKEPSISNEREDQLDRDWSVRNRLCRDLSSKGDYQHESWTSGRNNSRNFREQGCEVAREQRGNREHELPALLRMDARSVRQYKEELPPLPRTGMRNGDRGKKERDLSILLRNDSRHRCRDVPDLPQIATRNVGRGREESSLLALARTDTRKRGRCREDQALPSIDSSTGNHLERMAAQDRDIQRAGVSMSWENKRRSTGIVLKDGPGSWFYGTTPGVRVCVHFLKGECGKGSSCGFFHPTGDGEVMAWRAVFRKHKCKFGSGCLAVGCLYSHPGQGPKSPPPAGLPEAGVMSVDEQWTVQVDQLVLEAEASADLNVSDGAECGGSQDVI